MKTDKRSVAKGRPAGGAAPPADAPTATALKLWVVLARAFEAVSERSRAHVEPHGLTGAEFAILEALYHKGPLLLGEVQRKVLVSSGGITFLVDRLAARGLVERLACPTDRRARYAVLTRKGERVMRQLFPSHAAAIRDALSGLGLADQRVATALLRTLGLEAARLAAQAPGRRRGAGAGAGRGAGVLRGAGSGAGEA